MKKFLTATLVLGLLGSFTAPVLATPQEDLKQFREYFAKRFPKTPFNDYINGVYSVDAASREQWEEIEEFPPYELNLEKGKELFTTPFKNGKTYASCFDQDGEGIAHRYPFFDAGSGKIITLEYAINACRQANGEEPLGYKKGDIADISAYMHYTSRGNIINVIVPDDPRALAIYEQGKNFFYAKPPISRSTVPSGAAWGHCTGVTAAATSRYVPRRTRHRVTSTAHWSISIPT
jgi:sulfur-oxidizing protein SoxA